MHLITCPFQNRSSISSVSCAAEKRWQKIIKQGAVTFNRHNYFQFLHELLPLIYAGRVPVQCDEKNDYYLLLTSFNT